MNRKIKFRAIDGLGNQIFGIPQTSSTLRLTLDCMAQYYTEERRYGRQNVMFKPETLGQFTGLKDKKGKEIYEGDILKYRDRISGKRNKAKVYFEDGSFCFSVYAFNTGFSEELEVIGNIHENPELLK